MTNPIRLQRNALGPWVGTGGGGGGGATTALYTDTIRVDDMDFEGGAVLTDFVTPVNSKRYRAIYMPKGSDVHFDTPMHPKYDGSGVTLAVHWQVIDGSHGTQQGCQYAARYFQNTNPLDVAYTVRNFTLQADTANYLKYIDTTVLTIEGAYAANSDLYLTFFDPVTNPVSGGLYLLSMQLRYTITIP